MRAPYEGTDEMERVRSARRLGLAATMTMTLVLTGTATAAGAPGDGGSGTGSLYSDLVVALRAADGTPVLTEFLVPESEEAPETVEYCVQPASYVPVPGVTARVNPLDGRDVWVIPLQGEWIEDPVDPLPVEEIEPCDPQPQYAMFVGEAELERLNLTRTSEEVIARKLRDVETKLRSASTVSLDPAGRLSVDGVSLDAAPEYAAIYESLMTTGAVPGLDFADIDYDAWQLAAVAIGTAASKGVPITVDTVQYYNRIVGFTAAGADAWSAVSFIRSADPDPTTPMPGDVLPASERFVDYSGFSYNRADTFVGAVTWLDVAGLTWHVDRILDVVPWTNLRATGGLSEDEVNSRTLTGVTAFAQMADDARAVINYLHENEVVLPGFYMDPVGVDTYDAQVAATTQPAVQLTAPTSAFQTLPFGATAALYNPWGGTLVDEARVRVRVDAPTPLTAGDVTMTADGLDLPLTAVGGDLVGWWGPDTGTALDPGDRLSTDLQALVADGAPTGDYTLTLELVDVDDTAAVLATDSAVVTVRPSELSVLWGGELPVLGTQGTYYPLPVRTYAPAAQDAVLTFDLTGPGDDPGTDLLEELVAGDAKVYASNGADMVAMPLTLTGQDRLSGTWPASLAAGYTDLVWYLMVNEGAPVGQYGIDVGVEGGSDLADPAYVSFAAPATHGQEPPDNGEDTTPPVVMITIDAITSDSASFSFTTSEEDVTLETMLSVGGVKGEWEDASTGAKTYTGLKPGSYVFYVRATDADGNAATYLKRFTVVAPVVTPTPTASPTTGPSPTTAPTPGTSAPRTRIARGPGEDAWVLDDSARFVLDSDADDATYEMRLNGAEWEAQIGDAIMVAGLQPGLNRIRFRARSRGQVDATPVVRTVHVPHGIRHTTRSRAWTMHRHGDCFLGAYASTNREGQYVARYAHRVRRIALVVTTAPRGGRVNVYLGSRRLTRTPISLRSGEVRRNRLMMVHRFREEQTGRVRVVAVGDGPVRIEGIGLAR